MPIPNPLADAPDSDAEDRQLVAEAQAGSREALEALIRRHQAWIRVREVAQKTCGDVEALDDAYAELLRANPFLEPPDLVASLRALLDRPDFKSLLEFH